jgi:GT2 family glycosyltransferase
VASQSSISVVILTYNRKESLAELLEHLRGLASGVLETIVVDNASTDGTKDLVASRFPDIVYLHNGTNLGACGRNPALERARGEVIVTLDDDILGLEIPDLQTISDCFVENPSLGVLNFRVTDYFTGKICNWVHHCSPARATESFPTYEITEGAAAFRRAALRKTGYYWEPFFIGHEGFDLALRLMDDGFQVLYDGRVTVRHKHVAQARANWRFYYFDTRNQLWVAARRMRFRMASRYLLIGLSSMAFYSLRDGFVRWWFKALLDGLRQLPSVRRTRRPMRLSTEELVRRIDAGSPGFWAQARKRLRQPANRLDE